MSLHSLVSPPKMGAIAPRHIQVRRRYQQHASFIAGYSERVGRRSSRVHRSAISCFFAISICCTILLTPSKTTAQSVQRIADTWEARQNALRSARFTWKEEHFLGATPGLGIDHDATFSRQVTFSLSEGMYAYDSKGPRWTPQKNEFIERDAVNRFDGTLQKLFWSGFTDDPDVYPSGRIMAEDHPGIRGNIGFLAVLLAYRAHDSDLVWFDARKYSVSPKRTKINGHSCILFEQHTPDENGLIHYWLDEERDYVVCQAERRRDSGTLIWRLTADYTRAPEGLWVPSTWESTTSVPATGAVHEKCTAVMVSYDLNVNLPESTFQFEFPVGTMVIDARSGTGYIVRGDEDNRTVLPSEVEAGASYTDLVATDTGDAVPGVSARHSWRLAGVALTTFLVVACAVLACVRRWRS